MLQAKFHFEHVTQPTDRISSSNANQKLASADVDRQIAECREEANWLEMFRLLLWKGQLQQVHYTLYCQSTTCNYAMLCFVELYHWSN